MKKKPLGYLDLYDKLRVFQREMNEARENLRPGISSLSINALQSLDGVLYLVEGQLIHDADGAN